MSQSLIMSTATLFAMAVAVLLASFLIFLNSKKKFSNRIFAAFLILTAIDISGLFPFPSNGFWPLLDVMRSMLIFLHMPVFYAYIKSVCYLDYRLEREDYLGGLPFVIVVSFICFSLFVLHASEDSIFTQSQMFLVINVVLHLQLAFYLIRSFATLRKFKELYVNNYAGSQLEAYDWLFRLTSALSFFYLLALFKNIFKFTDSQEISDLLKTTLLIFELVVLCWYLFQAISKPDIFKGIHSNLKMSINETTHFDELKIGELQDLMKREKLFLDPNINVKSIAERMGISPRELSQLLNKHVGKHFFDFINEYRTKEAQEIFKKSNDNKLTVLEVLYEVGFNSKSSFNTAFKKHTGMTPTVYRKSL